MFKAKLTMPTPFSSDQLDEAMNKIEEAGFEHKEVQLAFDPAVKEITLEIY